MGVLKQVWRGMGNLPHVGEHPGTATICIMIGTVAFAGVQDGGIYGFLCGGVAGFVVLFPFYAWGAYDRAQLSDGIEAKKKDKNQNDR